MSERDIGFEGSSIKRMRLDDDDDSSSSLSSDSGEEDHHRSSSVSSGCCSSETNEIGRDARPPFLDLESHQEISETLIAINFRRTQGSSSSSENLAEMDSATKTERRRDGGKKEKKETAPTQAELDDFFSAAERCQQKRFTDKYNYDIVKDAPLEGRYEWVSLKP